MQRYCLALDLKDDEILIKEYEAHHEAVWPEVLESIHRIGVVHMKIYRVNIRLFMIIEVDETFDFLKMETMTLNNSKVRDWEQIMDNYQQRLPFAQSGEKWVLMNKIFDL